MKICRLFLIIFIVNSINYSQFNKPVLQIGFGLVQPFDDAKGTYYRYVYDNGLQLIAPDTNLFSNNYGAKTGIYFYGKIKINFDKYNIFRAVGSLSFSSFNSFEPSKTGFIERRVIINDTAYYYAIPSRFNYSFGSFGIGLGLELAPFAFTNVFSPYFGGYISFNSFNARLTRTENGIDTTSFGISDFRIGFNLDAGIEAKFSKMFGMVLGIKYDLGNVLLKYTASGISDSYDWGKSNASLNDEEGKYFTSIQSPLISSDLYLVNAKKKNINWGTIYLGVNIYFDAGGKNQPPKK